jgi:hypothetical protein
LKPTFASSTHLVIKSDRHQTWSKACCASKESEESEESEEKEGREKPEAKDKNWVFPDK